MTYWLCDFEKLLNFSGLPFCNLHSDSTLKIVSEAQNLTCDIIITITSTITTIIIIKSAASILGTESRCTRNQTLSVWLWRSALSSPEHLLGARQAQSQMILNMTLQRANGPILLVGKLSLRG